MFRVVLERLCSHLVERLHVDEALDESFLVHLHHVSGDAAEGERSLDALVYHALTYILHGSERSAARTGLYRKSVLEVAAVHDHLRSLLSEQNVARVLGVADGSRSNLRRVAYRFNLDHVVDVVLRDRVRSVRIRHEVVGEDHHLVGVVSVGQRVTERTADALSVLRARVAAGVAERV